MKYFHVADKMEETLRRIGLAAYHRPGPVKMYKEAE